jgi:hypothetical protein
MGVVVNSHCAQANSPVGLPVWGRAPRPSRRSKAPQRIRGRKLSNP